MKMLNRAIEDATDACAFIKKLQERRVDDIRAVQRMEGESRAERRARERAERKATLRAAKTQPKVKA